MGWSLVEALEKPEDQGEHYSEHAIEITWCFRDQ
jgi:hypothetical protein